MTSTVVAGGAKSAHEHFVSFYQEDSHLYKSVGRFLQEGLESGDGVVVVATAEHREGLCGALTDAGLDVAAARERGDLTLLDAEETLSRFLVGDLARGTLDADAFERVIGGVVDRAASGVVRRSVRAYGEMVALLFKQGNVGATAELEELWNRLALSYDFHLCCAYPMADFNRATHLEPFHRINPCGYAGLHVVSMEDLGGPNALDAVKPRLLEHLAVQFGLRLQSASPELFAAPSP